MNWFWRKNLWKQLKDKIYTLDALYGNRRMSGEGPYRRNNTRAEKKKSENERNAKAWTGLRLEKAKCF